MTWILPLFPAQPKLAPIFNPVTHMVPPAFPLLLIFPAAAIDALLRRTGVPQRGLRRVALAIALGAAFVAVFGVAQWFFSEFLLTPQADNWFFAGNRYWGYESSPVQGWMHRFWRVAPGTAPGSPTFDPFHGRAIAITLALSTGGAWLGLLWGGWMKKVRR